MFAREAMMQSSYHRYGDAPGLDQNPFPPEDGCAAEKRSPDLLTGITVGACIALAAISAVAIMADAWTSPPTQTACVLMER